MDTKYNFITLVNSIATKIVVKHIKNMPKEWSGIIASPTASPNVMCNVYINGDSANPPISIKNKTWETLSSGDEVILHSPSGSLGNCVILYKK